MDVASSFKETPDTLHEAFKFFGTRPFPNRFVLIRTNELAIFQVLSGLGVNNYASVGMCDVGAGGV